MYGIWYIQLAVSERDASCGCPYDNSQHLLFGVCIGAPDFRNLPCADSVTILHSGSARSCIVGS